MAALIRRHVTQKTYSHAKSICGSIRIDSINAISRRAYEPLRGFGGFNGLGNQWSCIKFEGSKSVSTYLPLSRCSGCAGYQHPIDVHTNISSSRKYSSNAAEDNAASAENVVEHQFQAETRMLLDIVARSLYSDKEVFIREIISNASDALEKLRCMQLVSPEALQSAVSAPLEVHLSADGDQRTLTVADSGIGMTREEMVDNLGTIARSGAKTFLSEMQKSADAGASADAHSIIGQFGVGFYSTFMVCDKVQVFSRSQRAGSGPAGHLWTSDGSGTFTVKEVADCEPGTKLVLHLKEDCKEFADESKLEEVIKKHSNFIGVPLLLNGQRINTIEALWCKDTKEINEGMHTEFYRFVSHMNDSPRYTLHYKADAPLNIQALFYVPETRPGLFEMSQLSDGSGVQLYSRKILIQSKAQDILPKYLRFVKGVVDSEDIPLNLSRELLQDSLLIRRLKTVLTNRLLRYFQDQARKDRVKFEQFFQDFGQFFREGIVSSSDQAEKEEIAKLLRFESSQLKAGQHLGLVDYVGKMPPTQKAIYFLAAPSRVVAEASPYLEGVRKRSSPGGSGEGSPPGEGAAGGTGESLLAASTQGEEILFCFQPYDELVLLQLQQFMGHPLKSAEKMLREDIETSKEADVYGENALSKAESDELIKWMKRVLAHKAKEIRATGRLTTHPCVVTVEDMSAARHFVRTQFLGLAEETRYMVLQPHFEINPSHAIIKKMHKIKDTNEDLAKLCLNQLYDNSMVIAGLVEDPRTVMGRMNQLLEQALSKH